jgi:hypothetical protein
MAAQDVGRTYSRTFLCEFTGTRVDLAFRRITKNERRAVRRAIRRSEYRYWRDGRLVIKKISPGQALEEAIDWPSLVIARRHIGGDGTWPDVEAQTISTVLEVEFGSQITSPMGGEEFMQDLEREAFRLGRSSNGVAEIAPRIVRVAPRARQSRPRRQRTAAASRGDPSEPDLARPASPAGVGA